MNRDFSKQGYYFSRTERRGILILLGICVCLITYKAMSVMNHEMPLNFSISEAASDAKVAEATYVHTESSSVPKSFPFDPNKADKSELLALGLSERVVKGILNYRKKGGQFHKAEDFAKIYHLPEAEYERLKPYIKLKKQEHTSKPAFANYSADISVHHPEFFDPNTADSATMVQAGLKSFVVKNLLKFRAKGAKFRTADDLKKIYGMDETQMEKAAPWVQIDSVSDVPPAIMDKETTFIEKKRDPLPTENFRISINTSGEEEWQKINGIGPGYARRIVQFREKLGGFIHINQVAETYNLPDSVFQKALPFLRLDSSTRQININTATVDQLSAHPYISKKQAQMIVNYRGHHGEYREVQDIKKLREIEDSWLLKVEPYLTATGGKD